MTMNQTGDVTVLDGDSVNISCFSTGNPVPTITWYLGTSVAPFPQSDTVNNLEARVTGFGISEITNGNITSVLMIENAAYPAHDGEYTCVGLNSNRGEDNTSNATINVQVQGKHIKCCSGIPTPAYTAIATSLVEYPPSLVICVVSLVPIQFHQRYRSQRLSQGLWLETPPPSPALSHEATPWVATPTDGHTTTPSLSVKRVACGALTC